MPASELGYPDLASLYTGATCVLFATDTMCGWSGSSSLDVSFVIVCCSCQLRQSSMLYEGNYATCGSRQLFVSYLPMADLILHVVTFSEPVQMS